MARDDSFSTVLTLVAFVYAIIAEAMSFYFWYDYINENGHNDLLYGALVGHGKGWLWVFFIW